MHHSATGVILPEEPPAFTDAIDNPSPDQISSACFHVSSGQNAPIIMDCEEARSLFRPRNQGLLEPGIKDEFHAHLRGCRRCEELLHEDFKLLLLEHLQDLVESIRADPPEIQRLANGLLHLAQMEDASAILMNSSGSISRIQMRIDSALMEGPVIEPDRIPPLISRFQRLADLRARASIRTLDERRSLGLEPGGMWDLAVRRYESPGVEIVEVDLWDQFRRHIGLDRTDLSDQSRRTLDGWLDAEGGLILVAGPPDSGRTTLLYSILRDYLGETVEPDWETVTIEELRGSGPTRWGFSMEDPPRIEMKEFSQVHVNRAAGLSYAAAIRSFIRKDPDILVIGDLSDRETVNAACSAALSQHIIVSVMTAPFSTGVFQALKDLGSSMEPAAEALTGVIATRLARRLCPSCVPSSATALGPPEIAEDAVGTGCAFCRGTGWRGRIALHETLNVTEEIRALIRAGTWETIIREQALASGALCPFVEDAGRKVENGQTTSDEVQRVIGEAQVSE
ncbi:MAG: Flp pilus assembly complex ATPase component TadA [Chloroflexi bacterium]|nr:Flp pilus assembly complex ATPase component TadA [Chloroflexota bacterium]